MILLDENWPEAERRQVAMAGFGVRQVGVEWGRKGMSDGEILAALRGQRRVTFLRVTSTSTSGRSAIRAIASFCFRFRGAKRLPTRSDS
mgnify:FL=1